MRGIIIWLLVLASMTSSETNAIQIRMRDDDEEKKTDEDSKEAADGDQKESEDDKEAVQTEADTKEKFNTDENGAVSLGSLPEAPKPKKKKDDDDDMSVSENMDSDEGSMINMVAQTEVMANQEDRL